MKKNFFLLSHSWWSYSKMDNVKSLHWGQINGNFFLLSHPWWSYSKIDNAKSLHQGHVKWKKDSFFCLSNPWWSYSKIDNVKSLHQGQVNEKNIVFTFAPMVVLLKDRQSQVPSLRASKWKKSFFFFSTLNFFQL